MHREMRHKRTLLHMGCGCSGCGGHANQVEDVQEIDTLEAPRSGMVPVYIGVGSGAADHVAPTGFAPQCETIGTPAIREW